MNYTLVKPDGTPGQTRDFADAPPTLAPNKGKWLPLVTTPQPPFDPMTHVLVAALAVWVDRVESGWAAVPRPEAEVAEERNKVARTRVAEIRATLADHIADHIAGTPAEQGQAKAAIGLLRAELAIEKAKLV